jgi:hypothetical protein
MKRNDAKFFSRIDVDKGADAIDDDVAIGTPCISGTECLLSASPGQSMISGQYCLVD